MLRISSEKTLQARFARVQSGAIRACCFDHPE